MSNFALARALTTGITVATLTTGILTVSVAAYAHGVGGQTGGGGVKGVPTITANKVTTTKSMDHTGGVLSSSIPATRARRTGASTGGRRAV